MDANTLDITRLSERICWLKETLKRASVIDDAPLMASCVSGPSGESLPEAGVHAGDVWQEEGQPQEAGGQTNQACAAGSPETRSLHQITPQLTWWVFTQSLIEFWAFFLFKGSYPNSL